MNGKYMNTNQNFADLASRGMFANDIPEVKQTANNVLLAKHNSWPKTQIELSKIMPVDDLEVKKVAVKIM